jgi:hypothetical protein
VDGPQNHWTNNFLGFGHKTRFEFQRERQESVSCFIMVEVEKSIFVFWKVLLHSTIRCGECPNVLLGHH